MEVQETLMRIQKNLVAPKEQTNNFGKYKYRSCEDILTAVKPHLGNATLTLSDEIVQIGVNGNIVETEYQDEKVSRHEMCDGSRFYVKATATITEGEQSISVEGWARECLQKKGMDAAQVTGAASSYARKYALNGLFCIDDVKDADTNEQAQERGL